MREKVYYYVRMRKLMLTIWALVTGVAAGMTTEEFRTLYETPRKGAEECWQLYEAYAQGDGVEKNDTQARKWLLAAHRCGKGGAREELLKLPWRKNIKGKQGVKVAKVDDETARAKGEELVRMLMGWRSENNINGISQSPCELSKEKMKEVRRLISEGADLNVVVATDRDISFHTALSVACEAVNVELAKLLIVAGADPCAGSMVALSSIMARYDSIMPRVKAGQSIKAARTEKGASRKVDREKKKTASIDPTVPVTAQELNSKKMIELLLKHGLDVNMWTDWGWSVGTMVVFEGSPLAAELLAKSGAKLNEPSRPEEIVSSAISASRMDYLTNIGFVQKCAVPIYVAAANMHDAVLQTLLRHGVDASAPLNKKGLTVQEFVEEQEKAMAAKTDGAPHMLERWKRCIQMLKALK